ncbi:MAG: hypothetical protein AAFX40_07585, partial [Cyanobacteria bacterium J06639_1]
TSVLGSVNLDVDGDANIFTISATTGTVAIDADGSIVDALANEDANIKANDITLTAASGTIGSSANPFEINSSFSSPGSVRAIAYGAIFLTETSGKLRAGLIRSQTADVTLVGVEIVPTWVFSPAGSSSISTTTETSGELRVGLIESQTADVTLAEVEIVPTWVPAGSYIPTTTDYYNPVLNELDINQPVLLA